MKTIRLLVTAVVSLTMCLVYADTWTEPDTGYTWTYLINGNTAQVSGVSPSSCAITIPATLGGKPVALIGDYAFHGCSGLTSVTIPNSVTSIGNSAFRGCSGLTSVTIPDSVTSIGNSAFRVCSGLTRVTIPGSVTNIGDNAFSLCDSLMSVMIPDSVTNIGSYAFSDCSGLTSVTIGKGVASIGTSAFSGCGRLISISVAPENTSYRSAKGLLLSKDGKTLIRSVNGNIIIPNSVTSIEDYAFSDCSGLTSVTIPDGVTSIGSYAFEGCSGLTSVAIGNSVASIGWGAFSGCHGLTSVTIPNSVTKIGGSAFSGCSGLTSITLPFIGFERGNSGYNSVFGNIFGTKGYSGGTQIRQYYQVSSYEDFYIPASLKNVIITDETVVGYGAFYNCDGLMSVTIPDGVRNIGDYVFYNCSGLKRVTIPDGVNSVGNYVFLGCNELTSVTVPQFACTQGLASVFPSICQTISHVAIHDNVTSIGYGAFSGCRVLQVVDVPKSVRRIGVGAFPDNVKLVIFHGAPPEVVDADGNVINPDTYSGGGVFGPYGSISSDVHVTYPPEFADAWGGELRRWCGAWAGCWPDVTITPGGKTVFSGSVAVSIESSWTNAVIHYTADGVEPTAASPVYRKPITVNRACTIKATAISPDCPYHYVVSAQFGYGRTADPRIDCSQWTTFYHRDNMVSFYSSTAGAEYVYTLDGSDPTKGGIKYTGPFSISTSTVVRVVAKSTDNVDSDVVSQTFTREWETVGTPEIETGDMDSANVVTISCWTDDAEIWYSTGGGYQRYTGPFRIFGATTVRAYAVKDDWLQSATATREIVKTWNDGGVVGQSGKIFASTTSSIWREDTSVSYSGGSSLRSGAIGDGKTSDLRFSVAGKGTISFHWRTSCEEDPYMHATDYVRFLVDGVEKGRLDGISGWEAFSARIDTDGPHVLTWEYVKDGSDSAGEDCAWVDEVKFAPDAVAWIRFNGNDSTSGTLPDSISHYLGEKVTLPARGTLARARYDFAGWSDGAKVYGPMAVYEAPDTDVTLLAAWVPRLTPPPTIHAPEQYAGVSTNFSISASGGAAIYYTIDGSEPTEASTRYWGLPIEVTGTTVIKAIAVAEDRFPSEVVTKTVECLWRSAIVNGVTWYYTADGTLKKGVGLSGKAVLPDKLNGTAITKIGGALFWVKGIGEVSDPVAIVVPEGIVEMEYMALEGCDNLEVIVLPSTLKKIGYSCFSECNCLARVYWCMSVPPAIDQGSEGRDDGGSVYWGSNASLISYLPKGWGDLSTHRWNERAFVEWTPPANGATGMIDEIVGKIVPKVMVTFNAHGGYSEETERAVDSGSAIGVLPVPTRTGYSFDGWYSAATGGTLFEATSKVTADITLHAHWTPIIYAIRYELEGGINAAENPSSYTVEQRIVLAAPRKTGYTFKGWTPNGGVIAVGSTGERLFVAVWELDVGEKSYTIMFNANGGNCESSARSVLKGGEYGELPVPTRTGYDFDGWFTAAEGGSCVSNKTVADKDVTLFAHWTPILYPITYVLGGGRNAAENPVTYTIEDAVVLLVPVRDGYLFTGWTPDGGRIAKGSIGERTFTATWKAPEPGTPIVVTFDANGGSVTETSRTVKSGAAVGGLPTPVRSGYTFAGWWTAASGGERISESTIVISNVTFYAHWTTGVSFLGVATWKFYEEADDDEGLNLAAWEEWSAADVPFWIGEGINMAIPVDGSFTADDVALVAGSYSDYGRPQVVSDEWMFAKHYTSLKTAIGYDPYEDDEYDQGAYGLVFEDDVGGRNYSLSMDIWPQKKVVSGRKWILLEMGGRPARGCKTFYVGLKGRDDVGYSRFRIYATPDQGVSQRPSDWSSQRELAVLPMPIGGGTTTGSGMYVNGTRVSLSATPVAGYEFEGWYDQSSGQQLGTSTSLTYVMGDANSVIIAKFTLATECFVTFDANGGTPKTQSVKQRSEELFVLPAEPKLADHLFMGWWTEKNGGVKVTDETVFLTGVYETLYAHWLSERVVQAQVLEKVFSGVVTVELGEDGHIVVTLTNDVSGTVEIPDNVGAVTIDLNGHNMVGDGGLGETALPGGPAIRIVKGDGESGSGAAATRLAIVDTSEGEKGQISGGGESAGIEVAEDAATGVKLDVEEGVGVFNGDGSEQEIKPKLLGTGKVTVPKTWKVGQKVTWKAVAEKGSVFAHWEGPLVDSLNLTKNERRNPSLAFAVPEDFETNMVTAVFLPIDDDGLYSLGITQTEFELKEAVSDVCVTDDSQSYVTASASGLPTGLKFDAKKMCITGAPTKGGVYWVQIKAKNASGYQWAENVKVTVTGDGKEAKEPKLTRTAYYPLTVICATEGGTVSGTGVYAEGKKVTIKATAAKGYVFAGWYETAAEAQRGGRGATALPAVSSKPPYLSLTASISVTVPEMRYVFAKFVTAEEDKDSIKLAVNGVEMTAGAGRPPYQTNIWAGVYMEWPVAASALSETKVKVAGLLAGLKFTDKPVTSKIGSGKAAVVVTNVPANTIYGAPTAASKAAVSSKPPYQGYVPSQVKITVTTAGKASQVYQIDATVHALPAWAQGAYGGGFIETALPDDGGHAGRVTLPCGTVYLTVDAKGKVSGKALGDGLTYTLAAPYYSAFALDENQASNFLADVTASWSYKDGTKTIKTNEVIQLVVQDNGIGGVVTGGPVFSAAAGDGGGQGLAALPEFVAWQYNWKVEPWKALGKKFDRQTAAYAIMDDGSFSENEEDIAASLGAEVVGRVTLKFAATGAVTIAGEFVTGFNEKTQKYTTVKATGSATLVPVDEGGGYVFIYLTPKGLPPHARCVDVPWPR